MRVDFLPMVFITGEISKSHCFRSLLNLDMALFSYLKLKIIGFVSTVTNLFLQRNSLSTHFYKKPHFLSI